MQKCPLTNSFFLSDAISLSLLSFPGYPFPHTHYAHNTSPFQGTGGFETGILRDKTMDDNLMYIPKIIPSVD